MSANNACHECGTPLPENAPEGLCPKCLMRLAMGESHADAILDNPAKIDGPGTTVGQYKLLELIGEGGMGLVYLAEQKEPVKRTVALKIVKLGMDTMQMVARFRAEQQTLAILDHPNIAQVFDAGTTESGRPYFVMEYVEGVPITKYCDRQKLSIDERLHLFLQVCAAIQHAHQKGVLHRDIKPSNILVSANDHAPLPKIIDFGIAKAVHQPLTEQTSITEQGQLLGTPEYMSPEQADMAYSQVDTRSDVYSLGVVLYELLAGAPPFEGETLREGGIERIRQIIRDEEPKTPSARLTALGEQAKEVALMRRTQLLTLARRLKKELEWIPLKAMRKEPDERYQSVSELAQDISNYLTGAALFAGPESRIYRTRKFIRKHAGSVATAALVAVVIVLGFIVSTALSLRAENARQEEAAARTQAEQAEMFAEKQRELAEEQQKLAEEQRKIAEEQAGKYRNLSYIHGIALADVKYREGNLRSTRQLLKSCPEDLRNWEWHRLNYILDEAVITPHPDEPSGVLAVAFRPDGKWVASGGASGKITMWDAESGSEMATFKGHDGPVSSVAYSTDGERIVSGGSDKFVKVWNVSSGGELMRLEGHETRIAAIDLSPDGKLIVSGDYRGTVKVWDSGTGAQLLTIRGDGKCARSVAFSPDSKRILAGKVSDKIHEWDVSTGEEMRTFTIPNTSILIVDYSPDGERVALGCYSGMIKIVDLQTNDETVLTSGHGYTSLVTSLAFSPDSRRLVSGGYDRAVRIWDVSTGEELTALVGHTGRIDEVAFSPDGKRIASASYTGELKIWDPATDRESKVLKGGHTATVRDVVFTPDGNRLISASRDKTIKMWDVSKGEVIHTFAGHENSVWSVAISPDGRYIVSGSGDNTIRIWDITSGEQVRKITGHGGAVFSVAFSPDSKRIISGGRDKTIRVWDASTGEELKTLSGHRETIYAVAYSPDGRRIVAGGNGVVKIWDAKTSEELKTLSGHKRTVCSISFTPSGKGIISGSYDGTVRFWDAATGDELRVLEGHNGNVEAVTVSPDGKRIASASHDSTVKLWDAATGAELMTLPVSNGAFGVTFSPDGKTIASAGDEEVVLWESAPCPDVGSSDRSGESIRRVVD